MAKDVQLSVIDLEEGLLFRCDYGSMIITYSESMLHAIRSSGWAMFDKKLPTAYLSEFIQMESGELFAYYNKDTKMWRIGQVFQWELINAGSS